MARFRRIMSAGSDCVAFGITAAAPSERQAGAEGTLQERGRQLRLGRQRFRTEPMRAMDEGPLQEGRRPLRLGVERQRTGSVHATRRPLQEGRRSLRLDGERLRDRINVTRVSRDSAVPELPEVEAVRRELAPVMRGARFQQVIVRRAGLRTLFPDQFAARLRGRTVRALTRRGKYLLADLSSGDTLLMHLGMSGSFHVERPTASIAARVLAAAPDDGGPSRPRRVPDVVRAPRSPSTIRDASA